MGNVWVEDGCLECHDWRKEWVEEGVCGEVNGQVEDSSLVWTLWWSLDGCLPLAKTNSEAKLFWSKALTSEKSTNLN